MPSLSVVITTLDEELNVARAVRTARLVSDDVLVLDSGSRDATVAIAHHEGARVMTRPFDDMASQRNAALADGNLSGQHVLFIDADEMVTAEFARALKALLEQEPVLDGVRICRRFHWHGKWIRSASSFPRFIDRVVRRGAVTFRKEAHGEVFVGGTHYARLDEPLHDEDLKPISHWLDRHVFYARMEAEHALAQRAQPGTSRLRRWRARLRRLPGWPLLALAYYLFVRRGILEGPRGWSYCTMKATYEYFVQLCIRDALYREDKGRQP